MDHLVWERHRWRKSTVVDTEPMGGYLTNIQAERGS